ncbi:phage antirepressor KilAC domain-containing protein [Microbacterium sp. NPDC089698]|uniref:phage antirepressor KilAC domain-containing protein n=1 Tax=Microbacterium sp. NPDC089698 TaxID=3364200 RepID=UPI003825E300
MSALDIINQGGTLVVSSEQIATGTGAEHASILRTIDNNRDDFEDFGHLRFEIRDAYNNHKTRVAMLSEPQATLLMTFMRNIGPVKEFKKALVKAFFEMARRLSGPAVPQSLPEALRAYAAEVEQRQALEARVAADAPKVLFADSVATSDTTILVGDLAKILRGNGVQVGANRLFEMLRNDGFLIRRPGSDWNMPTQRAMELELFRVKETAITHSDGHVSVSKTPKVTGKGQAYFINRYAMEVAR